MVCKNPLRASWPWGSLQIDVEGLVALPDGEHQPRALRVTVPGRLQDGRGLAGGLRVDRDPRLARGQPLDRVAPFRVDLRAQLLGPALERDRAAGEGLALVSHNA